MAISDENGVHLRFSEVPTDYSTQSPHFLSILRVVAGLLFMPHGSQKLFGFPGSLPEEATHELFSLMGIGGILEFFGGLLFLGGFYTRLISFILCGEMAVAFFRAHIPQGLWPILNGGELALLYCFMFLYFTFAGGGAWSLDQILRRR